jgi:Nucleotidyl transferase AbiEii toxin, Type IV TA system
MTHGYGQNKKLRKFQLVRRIEATDEGDPIDIVVDFLMPRDAVIDRNKPPIIEDFAVQRADGTDLAMRFNQMVAVRGAMPKGGTNQVEIAVCSIPALLAMKGYAVHNRLKQKDAYDIYYCIRNYPDGIDALAKDCLPLLNLPSGRTGYGFINEKFDAVDGFGPTCVKSFVQESKILADRTPDQWQQDAFGQVDAWLRAMGLRA